MLQPAYDLSHVYGEHGRWHRCGVAGPTRPGVTTVLGRTVSPEKAATLDAWRARVGADQAELIKKRATDLGSYVHAKIEAALLDQPFSPPPGITLDEEQLEKAAAMWRKAQPILGEVSRVWCVELPCQWAGPDPQELTPSWGYAGSVDCIAEVHGQVMLLDWKTTSSGGGSKPRSWTHDYELQCSAYVNAAQFTYPELPPIEMAAIVTFPASGRPSIIELDREELLHAANEFGEQRLTRFYEQLRKEAKDDLLALA